MVVELHVRRLACLIALGLLFLGAAPASADIPPPPAPPGVTVPGPTSMPTGPTYEVTPGVGGTRLPSPVDPKVAAQHAKDAKKAQQKATTSRAAGAKNPQNAEQASSPNLGRPPAQVAGSPATLSVWWQVGAGGLLALLLVDALRSALSLRRRTVA